MASDARIKRGQHLSPLTEFKKGQHWRIRKHWWSKDWLFNEYITNQRSASDIAKEGQVTENAIYFWLAKHGIPRRKMSEIRATKYWGLTGIKNGQYGKRGILNPNWKGGLTPLRQKFYSRLEWKQLVRDVHARDKCCRLCLSKERLEIHHIDPFSQSPLLMLDIGNVILLCHCCHARIRNKENKWKSKLYKLIERR